MNGGESMETKGAIEAWDMGFDAGSAQGRRDGYDEGREVGRAEVRGERLGRRALLAYGLGLALAALTAWGVR